MICLYRTIETTRAAMKKLRFAPGKGNTKMFVLYNNRIDVREAVEVSTCMVISLRHNIHVIMLKEIHTVPMI